MKSHSTKAANKTVSMSEKLWFATLIVIGIFGMAVLVLFRYPAVNRVGGPKAFYIQNDSWQGYLMTSNGLPILNGNYLIIEKMNGEVFEIAVQRVK